MWGVRLLSVALWSSFWAVDCCWGPSPGDMQWQSWALSLVVQSVSWLVSVSRGPTVYPSLCWVPEYKLDLQGIYLLDQTQSRSRTEQELLSGWHWTDWPAACISSAHVKTQGPWRAEWLQSREAAPGRLHPATPDPGAVCPPQASVLLPKAAHASSSYCCNYTSELKLLKVMKYECKRDKLFLYDLSWTCGKGMLKGRY